MLLLSLFSSSQSVSIALYKKTKLLKFQEFNFEKNQNEKIFDCIKKIFINKKLNDLSEIIFLKSLSLLTNRLFNLPK